MSSVDLPAPLLFFLFGGEGALRKDGFLWPNSKKTSGKKKSQRKRKQWLRKYTPVKRQRRRMTEKSSVRETDREESRHNEDVALKEKAKKTRWGKAYGWTGNSLLRGSGRCVAEKKENGERRASRDVDLGTRTKRLKEEGKMRFVSERTDSRSGGYEKLEFLESKRRKEEKRKSLLIFLREESDRLTAKNSRELLRRARAAGFVLIERQEEVYMDDKKTERPQQRGERGKNLEQRPGERRRGKVP